MTEMQVVSKKLVLNYPKLDAYLKSPSGDVWKWLDKRGDKVVHAAKRQVGVKTGHLRASIHMRHTTGMRGQELWIGSEVKYGYLHHEGTRAHTIAPKNGGVLVLRSGKMVHGSVRHPGTKPNRFLSDNLYHFRY
jgi:hypothetical protein